MKTLEQIAALDVLNSTLTAQEIFDYIALHLLRQGKRAIDIHGGCVLRSAGGLKCAFGAVLTDEEAVLCGRGSVGRVSENGLMPDRLIGHKRLLARLQSLHDGFTPDTWPYYLRAESNWHELDGSVVDLWKESVKVSP